MFQSGTIPAEGKVGLVTPVFKKGDPFDTWNLRPIAVTEPLMRFYASIMNTGLQEFTEECLRADTQAELRPGFSAVH
jgi:hypothetical protein